MVQIPVADEFLTLDQVHPVAQVGNKAHNLGRLCVAGLPVPAGFVAAYDALPPDTSLAAIAANIAGPMVVRSSASAEDANTGNAPGLFLSIRDIDHAGLGEAMARVRASAQRAADYPIAGPVRMAVIVQRQVSGIGGTLYTRTSDDMAFAEARLGDGSHAVASIDRDSGACEADATFPVDVSALLELGERCEQALQRDSLDIEWVHDGAKLWVVQARPLLNAEIQPLVPMKLFAFTQGDDQTWRWDAEHNPTPLSLAQQGLVEHVDAARVAPFVMRIVAGHLYYASSGNQVAPFESAEEVRHCLASMEQQLAPVTSVADAVAAYERFYRIYATCSPRLRKTPARLLEPYPRNRLRDALRRVAPLWDVASAPYGEDVIGEDDLVARYLANPAERDDLYFGRAQQMVRVRLLALADELEFIDPHDIFWVPLADVLAWETSGAKPDPVQLAAVARRNRETAAVQSRWRMPLSVKAGEPIDANNRQHGVWRGYGTGGRVTATVATPATISEAPAGSALVAATVTPQMVVLARHAACIVSEYGGALGHAVAMAAELDIPCVVGCRGASTHLRDGHRILVDGARGLVVRLTR